MSPISTWLIGKVESCPYNYLYVLCSAYIIVETSPDWNQFAFIELRSLLALRSVVVKTSQVHLMMRKKWNNFQRNQNMCPQQTKRDLKKLDQFDRCVYADCLQRSLKDRYKMCVGNINLVASERSMLYFH